MVWLQQLGRHEEGHLESLGVQSILERQEKDVDTWQVIIEKFFNLILNLNFKFKICSNFGQSKTL